jgi:putative ABC transport system permease protein
MSSFLAALKRHEVGIRKALGAGFWEIYAIFAQYFLPLLLIGIILGNILATIINFLWLNSFAFHVSFHFVPYFVSSLVVILIALLIISFHAVRSALSNPVDDLNNF